MSRLNMMSGLLALALLLPACAVGPAKESKSLDEMLADKGYRVGEEIQQIQMFKFNNWTRLDNLHFILHSRVTDHYLVTLGSACDGLLYGATINLSSTVGQFTKFDYVVVSNPNRMPERCHVKTLNELEKIEQKASAD
jgi:hypothetical protein